MRNNFNNSNNNLNDFNGNPFADESTSTQYEKKNLLLFVVGGLSFIEIAAFRLLSKDPYFPYRIILSTTKLINGNTFLKSLQF